MDDYLSRVFVEPTTKSNHIRNSEGTGLDDRLTAKQALSIASRDYFTMNIDVPGNFTLNVGDLVWCEVPSYNASEATVSLGAYAMGTVGNAPDVPGEYEYWNPFDEGAEVAAGDVFVVCHPDADPIIQENFKHIWFCTTNNSILL